MIEEKDLTHDELVKNIFLQYDIADKSIYVSLFLSSLSTDNLNWRSGLSVFSIMQTFPNHCFTLVKGSENQRTSPCKICSYWQSRMNRKTSIVDYYLTFGGLIHPDIQNYYYYLLETNKLKPIKPIKEDFRIFSEILTILLEADENDTVKKTVLSKIGKIKGFKSNKKQVQVLLETLGYCSILETNKHKGLIDQYTNLGVAPRKAHSSDWGYPVDFWMGKYGINKQAFKFWFVEFKELEVFWG